MSNQSAFSHTGRYDKESGRLSKPELDLSVRGHHMGYAAAKPTAQPKYSVKWDDEHPRPRTSPESAYGSSRHHDWAGTRHQGPSCQTCAHPSYRQAAACLCTRYMWGIGQAFLLLQHCSLDKSCIFCALL